MVTEKNKIEEEYFIPYVLPSYDPQNDILVQYGYLHGEPLMIQFHSGLLPRGLFCCLIVELLQHPPKGWHPHLSHKGIHHTFSNLITFSLPNGYSLSLLDKVSYLEIQVRHPEIVFHDPAHISVFNYLIYALTEVCIYLTFDYERLQYGFLCQCGEAENHLAVLPDFSCPVLYSECSIDTVHRMKLNSSHLVWFFLQQSTISANGRSLHFSVIF